MGRVLGMTNKSRRIPLAEQLDELQQEYDRHA